MSPETADFMYLKLSNYKCFLCLSVTLTRAINVCRSVIKYQEKRKTKYLTFLFSYFWWDKLDATMFLFRIKITGRRFILNHRKKKTQKTFEISHFIKYVFIIAL